ncbi:MAG: hemolysin family protein [Phycisphaerae bacterium]
MWGEFFATHTWQVLAMLALLGLSGFFSGTETALFSLSIGQLHRLGEGGASSRLVLRLMRKPRRVLNTLLLGNMLVNVAFSAVAAVLVLDLRHVGARSWQLAIATALPVVLLILGGEVTPKMIAITLAQRWSMAVAGVLAVVQKLLLPVVWILEYVCVIPLVRIIAPHSAGEPHISSKELNALLDLSAKRGIIDHDANTLLQEIVELTDIRVSEVMVPRVDMVAYDVNNPAEGLLQVFRRTHLPKVPVYDGTIDNILGVVHAKRLLLNPKAPLRELTAEIPFVPETANIERALLQFRVSRTQMAIVVDEYGGTAGLVTLEDILEEIVGDIPDPDEVRSGPAVRKLSDTEYLLDGDLSIHEWSDVFGTDITERRVSTVGGFVTRLLGRVARVGDTVSYGNLEFTVESVRRRRVGKIRLQLTDEQPDKK